MLIEAARQALDCLQSDLAGRIKKKPHAIASLRQAIEQSEKQEPVTWLAPRYEGGHENLAVVDKKEFDAFPVYTTPQPQREWVGLTDEELKPLCDVNHIIYGAYTVDFVRSIEAKLKEKNT